MTVKSDNGRYVKILPDPVPCDGCAWFVKGECGHPGMAAKPDYRRGCYGAAVEANRENAGFMDRRFPIGL
jgi:hypothetical protein